jgi:hypothetical protein
LRSHRQPLFQRASLDVRIVVDVGLWSHTSLIVVLVAGAACVACGDPSGASASGRDAGTGGSGSGGAGGSGGSATGGSGGSDDSSAAGGSGGVPLGDGQIFAEQTTEPLGFTLEATFESWESGPRCTSRTLGACRIDVCDRSSVPRRAAGTVGVSSGVVERTISPIDTLYPGINEAMRLWEDGASVRLFAQGGEVPGLDETLIGPGPLTVLEPLPTAGEVLVDRAQPLVARWSGGAGASVVVAVGGQNANEDNLTVQCSFSPSDGVGTVPSSELAELSPAWTAAVYVFAQDYRIVRLGVWQVRLATRRDVYNQYARLL